MLTGALSRLLCLLCLCVILLDQPASANDLARFGAALAFDQPGKVVSVVDGDTLLLADGREIRLVGLQAPKLPLGRKGFKAWPLAPEAKAALESFSLGETLAVGYGGARQDRHGRRLAHLFRVSDGQWLQGQLLSEGWARVYSFADNRALVSDMLTREADARDAGRGIWSHPFYRPRDPVSLDRSLGRFEIVEGRVLDAAVVRGRGYLNFGEDWREDFTASLAPAVRRLFESEGIEIGDYKGRDLRLRGWVKSFNGPMIEITHPEQIEIMTPED